MSGSQYGGNHAPQKAQQELPRGLSSSEMALSSTMSPTGSGTSVVAAPVILSIHFWTSSSELSQSCCALEDGAAMTRVADKMYDGH